MAACPAASKAIFDSPLCHAEIEIIDTENAGKVQHRSGFAKASLDSRTYHYKVKLEKNSTEKNYIIDHCEHGQKQRSKH